MFYNCVKLKNFTVFLLSALVGCVLIIFSDSAYIGVINGLKLSTNSVIPSLFLFTTLSLFLFESDCISLIANIVSPLTKRLLGLNGEEFCVLVLSFVAGYPMGANLINNLCANGSLSCKKAKIMLKFCINAGPAFIISTIGCGFLSSKSDGLRLFLASLFSSFTLLFISIPALKRAEKSAETKKNHQQKPLSDVFVSSVSKAGTVMLTITAFVIIFSGISEIISCLNLPHWVKTTVLSLLEVTTGIKQFGRLDLPIIAFLLCFGGISVQLQVLSSMKSVKISFLKIALWRILGGIVSAFFVDIFEIILPRTDTVANMSAPTMSLSSQGANPLGVAALLLMVITLVVSTAKTLKYNT